MTFSSSLFLFQTTFDLFSFSYHYRTGDNISPAMDESFAYNALNISINREQFKTVPSYKYLGVNLDETLNFKYLSLLVIAISFK